MMIARNSRSTRHEWTFQPWPRRNAAFGHWDGGAVVNARAARPSVSWRRGPVLILLMTVCATILRRRCCRRHNCSRTTLGGTARRPCPTQTIKAREQQTIIPPSCSLSIGTLSLDAER